MRTIIVAAVLLAVSAFASAAPGPQKQMSFVGAGEIVHEGLFLAELGDVTLSVTLRQVYTPPPGQRWVGDATLSVHTSARDFDLDVDVDALLVTGGAAGRVGDAMEVALHGGQGEGTMLLTGLDGFLRGGGVHEFVVNGGPNQGHYDVVYGGLARVEGS